jgi:hypothetical protein
MQPTAASHNIGIAVSSVSPGFAAAGQMAGPVVLFFNLGLADCGEQNCLCELVHLFSCKIQSELNPTLKLQVRESAPEEQRKVSQRLARY